MLKRFVRQNCVSVRRPVYSVQRHSTNDSTLRAKPWSFPFEDAPLRKNHGTSTTRFNFEMGSKADTSQFHSCFDVAVEMKRHGSKPDILTYNILLRALAHGGYAEPTLAVLEDMIAVGISPDTTSFNYIIDAHRTQITSFLPPILRRMEQLQVTPNTKTFTLIITRFVSENNLETALRYYWIMKNHGVAAEVSVAQALIVLAAKSGHPRLAVDLVAAFETEGVRKVDVSVWLACLQASASDLYAEGVQKSWDQLNALGVSLDEGMCMLVLHTAARNGLPDLAGGALHALQTLSVPWQEYHLGPLFEAYCRVGRFEDAFESLSVMRANGIIPTALSAAFVLEVTRADPTKVAELWTLLEKMKENGKTIDPVVFSSLLQASLTTEPLAQALGHYTKTKLFGVELGTEIFHIFINACISAKNAAFGELAFRQLINARATPDHDVYGKMIALHLTQETYDDAFHYLEQLQAAGFTLAQELYEALVLKCASHGDARYQIALDEMKQCGYRIRPDFDNKYRSRLQHANSAPVQSAQVSEADRVYIETGGLSSSEQ